MKGTIRIFLALIMFILAVGVIEDCGGACVRPLEFFDWALVAAFTIAGVVLGLSGAAAAQGDQH